jgi:hypothetical protein
MVRLLIDPNQVQSASEFCQKTVPPTLRAELVQFERGDFICLDR